MNRRELTNGTLCLNRVWSKNDCCSKYLNSLKLFVKTPNSSGMCTATGEACLANMPGGVGGRAGGHPGAPNRDIPGDRYRTLLPTQAP